jgi:hypothetical protein
MFAEGARFQEEISAIGPLGQDRMSGARAGAVLARASGGAAGGAADRQPARAKRPRDRDCGRSGFAGGRGSQRIDLLSAPWALRVRCAARGRSRWARWMDGGRLPWEWRRNNRQRQGRWWSWPPAAMRPAVTPHRHWAESCRSTAVWRTTSRNRAMAAAVPQITGTGRPG